MVRSRRGSSVASTHREQTVPRSLSTSFTAAAGVRLMGGMGSKIRTGAVSCRDTPPELLPTESTRNVHLLKDEIEVGEEPSPYMTSRRGGAVEIDGVGINSLLPHHACHVEYHTCCRTEHLREQPSEILPTHKESWDGRLRGGGGVETVTSNREVHMNSPHSRISRRGDDFSDVENGADYRTNHRPSRTKHFREMESELGDHQVEHSRSQKLTVRKNQPFHPKDEPQRDVEMVSTHNLYIYRHDIPSPVPRKHSAVSADRSQVHNHTQAPQEHARLRPYKEQPQKDCGTLSHREVPGHYSAPTIKEKCSHCLSQRQSDSKYSPNSKLTPGNQNECNRQAFISRPCSPLSKTNYDKEYSKSNSRKSKLSMKSSNHSINKSTPVLSKKSVDQDASAKNINSKCKHEESNSTIRTISARLSQDQCQNPKHTTFKDESKCSNVTNEIVKPSKKRVKEGKRHAPTKSGTSQGQTLDVKVLHKRSRSAPPRSSTCFLQTDESSTTSNINTSAWRLNNHESDHRSETRPIKSLEERITDVNATDSVHRDATSSNALLLMVPVRSQLTPKEIHEQFCEEIKEKYHHITRKCETLAHDEYKDIDDMPLPSPPTEEVLYPKSSRELSGFTLPSCNNLNNCSRTTNDPSHHSHTCSRPQVVLRSISECSSQTIANEKSLAQELSEMYQQQYPTNKHNAQFYLEQHESEHIPRCCPDSYYTRHVHRHFHQSDAESLKSGEFPSYRRAKEIFERKMEKAKKEYDLSLYKYREKQLKTKLKSFLEHSPSPRERRHQASPQDKRGQETDE